MFGDPHIEMVVLKVSAVTIWYDVSDSVDLWSETDLIFIIDARKLAGRQWMDQCSNARGYREQQIRSLN